MNSHLEEDSFEKLVSAGSSVEGPPVEDEESIDDYFSRLMERVQRGVSVATGAAPVRESKVYTPEPAPRPREAAPPPVKAEEKPQTPKQEVLTELTPLRSSPENTAGLAQMRALANQSTRQATNTHFHKVARREYLKLGQALVAIGVAFLLLELWRSGGAVYGFLAYGAIGLSVVLSFRYFQSTRRLVSMVKKSAVAEGRALKAAASS